MLRVEFQDGAHTLRVKVEGRFVAAFAENARDMMARCAMPRTLVIDLSEVTFVDSAGEEVLSWLGGIGGEFVAESSYSRDVCERLHLPLARKNAQLSSPRRTHAPR
jgi:hypothetical protein